MVEKIIVQPEKVRGGGNIVSPPKTVTDFSLYNSTLSLVGSVYSLAYQGQLIVVSLSVSPVSVSVGESVTFTASVTEDGDPLEGVTVSFKEGSTVIGTGDTNSSGVATLVKSDLTVGSHSVVAEYSTGVSSAVSVTVSDVPTPVPASVSLTGTKSILSYADSEQSVLTATVLDANDDPMEGVTVTFYNGSTSMGTADTNSSGIASKTYSSAGAGDVSFTAEVGSLVSETYSIEDCIFYDNALTDKTSKYSTVQNKSSASITITNNGEYNVFNATHSRDVGWIDIGFAELDIADNWVTEIEVMQTAPSSPMHLGFDFVLKSAMTNSVTHCMYDSTPYAGNYGYGTPNSWLAQGTSSSGGSINQWYSFKFENRNGVINAYMYDANNNLKYSATFNMPSNYANQTVYACLFGFGNKAQVTRRFKNVKVKPL